MKLPKEIEDRKWAQEYLSELEKMTDEELFDSAFDDAVPDGYDGCFTTRGYWRACISKEYLYERFMEYVGIYLLSKYEH